MADDAQTQTTRAALGKARMEAFSDGVLAIAITLLVLDLGYGQGKGKSGSSPLRPAGLSYPG
jgi:uncharacterized membrane protein